MPIGGLLGLHNQLCNTCPACLTTLCPKVLPSFMEGSVSPPSSKNLQKRGAGTPSTQPTVRSPHHANSSLHCRRVACASANSTTRWEELTTQMQEANIKVTYRNTGINCIYQRGDTVTKCLGCARMLAQVPPEIHLGVC